MFLQRHCRSCCTTQRHGQWKKNWTGNCRVWNDCSTLYSRGHSQRPTQELRHQVGAGCDKECGESYTCQATLIFPASVSYFGHVARMWSSRIPNIMMYGRVQGRRPVGRPKKRWLDNVREDCHLLDMNMEYADRLARNRVQWRSAVRWLLERIDSSMSQKH